MRYIHSDSMERIHPHYDFERERDTAPRRYPSWDLAPHEYEATPPYDGILVSHATAGMGVRWGKYTLPQRMALMIKGARGLLRYPEDRFAGSWTMGDSGSFSVANTDDTPPIAGTLQFYDDGRFTHGISPDAIVFEWIADGQPPSASSIIRRGNSLTAAELFIRETRAWPDFTPMGAAQGWNVASLASSVRALAAMGYRSIAIGGMVPLDPPEIDRALAAAVPAAAGAAIHVLGFGKPAHLGMLRRHGVTSFDTASPMVRAVKDANRNYWTLDGGTFGALRAIRVPLATESNRLKASAREGKLDQGKARVAEARALGALHAYGRRAGPMAAALSAVSAYWDMLGWTDGRGTLPDMAESHRITLEGRPWERCGCRSCRDAGVAVVLLRSAATNRRRGFHNMGVLREATRLADSPNGTAAELIGVRACGGTPPSPRPPTPAC